MKERKVARAIEVPRKDEFRCSSILDLTPEVYIWILYKERWGKKQWMQTHEGKGRTQKKTILEQKNETVNKTLEQTDDNAEQSIQKTKQSTKMESRQQPA